MSDFGFDSSLVGAASSSRDLALNAAELLMGGLEAFALSGVLLRDRLSCSIAIAAARAAAEGW